MIGSHRLAAAFALTLAATAAALVGCSPPPQYDLYGQPLAGTPPRGDAAADLRDRVDVRDDPFRSAIAVLGIERDGGNETGNPYAGDRYFLRSQVGRESCARRHQLYVVDHYRGRDRFWRSAATDRRDDLEVVAIDFATVSCAGDKCLVVETFAATLDEKLLRERAGGFAVRFYSRRGDTMTLRVDARQIAAQLAAVDGLCETGKLPGKIRLDAGGQSARRL